MAFDGDCRAQADRLLTLEPLTRKIRYAMAQLHALGRERTDLKAALIEAQDPTWQT